jgi:hypothetical protein
MIVSKVMGVLWLQSFPPQSSSYRSWYCTEPHFEHTLTLRIGLEGCSQRESIA